VVFNFLGNNLSLNIDNTVFYFPLKVARVSWNENLLVLFYLFLSLEVPKLFASNMQHSVSKINKMKYGFFQ